MGGNVENSSVAVLLPPIPKGENFNSFTPCPGSSCLVVLVTIGFGFTTSISTFDVANSPFAFAIISTDCTDSEGNTSNSKFTIFSPTSVKFTVLETFCKGFNPDEVFTVTSTDFNDFSIAKTVTGSVTLSPGESFRGKEARTMSGFFT